MKKIEAIIDPAALDAVKRHLAAAGVESRLTVMAAKGIESPGGHYEHQTTSQDQWKAWVKIDLIVSERQAESAVNIILRQANLANSSGNRGHINILALDATFEIGADNPKPPTNLLEPRKAALRRTGNNC